jgi:hypothetical protein
LHNRPQALKPVAVPLVARHLVALLALELAQPVVLV